MAFLQQGFAIFFDRGFGAGPYPSWTRACIWRVTGDLAGTGWVAGSGGYFYIDLCVSTTGSDYYQHRLWLFPDTTLRFEIEISDASAGIAARMFTGPLTLTLGDWFWTCVTYDIATGTSLYFNGDALALNGTDETGAATIGDAVGIDFTNTDITRVDYILHPATIGGVGDMGHWSRALTPTEARAATEPTGPTYTPTGLVYHTPFVNAQIFNNIIGPPPPFTFDFGRTGALAVPHPNPATVALVAVGSSEVGVAPFQDTIRGGAFLIIGRTGVLDTTRDQALTSAPLGWTPSGGVTYDTRDGVTLTNGTLTTSNSDYVHFDISVDVRPLEPVSAPAATTFIACLEHEVSSTVVRVCLVRGANATTDLIGLGEAFADDPAAGVTAPLATDVVTLRLVRHGARLYGFVGTTQVLDARLDDALASTTGPVRLASRASSSGDQARAVFKNYRVRSHARINDRLLENKDVPNTRQITGDVPAATLAEVGQASVYVFGLFGEVLSNGFEYTLPAPRTVGNEVVRTFRSYQDPVVRDATT